MTKSTHKQTAQILLVTLLVLTILAIMVVGIVGVVSRDVQQTVNNQEYERLYNIAETNVFRLINKYGNPGVAVNEVTGDYPGQCTQLLADHYVCQFQDGTVTTRLEIEDTNEVHDYDLAKDESLELQLSGYNGDISYAWVGTAALEFGIVYLDGGEYKFIGDVFDLDGIFTSGGGNPLTDPSGNHAFPFQNDPVRGAGWYRFNIRNIAGLPAGATPISLRVTSRQRLNTGIVMRLDLLGNSGFPDQIRIITSTSYDNNTDVDAIASVVTQIPIFPQAAPVLHYALGTQDVVDK